MNLQEVYQNVHLYYLKMNISNDIWQNQKNKNIAFEVMLLHEQYPNLIESLQKGSYSILILEKRLRLVL
jgi:hypothetical protein